MNYLQNRPLSKSTIILLCDMRKSNFVVNIINLILGSILLFLISTDIELNSTVANLIFPMIVLIVGIISYRKITDPKRGKIFFYLPSFIGGVGFYIIVSFVFLINFIGCFYMISEEINKVKIQRCYSPNQMEYCDVYHYPVGAYSGGTGRVRVFLLNKYFPIIRQEIFYERTAHILIEDEKNDIPYNYCVWKDTNNIEIYPQGHSTLINVRRITFYPIEILKYLKQKDNT